jgi:DNA modification methylase
VTPYASGKRWTIYNGDALDWLASVADDEADICVTDSPYSINTKSDGDGKLNPWADYCNAALWYTTWIRDVRRVLRPHGALFACLNWRSQVPFQKAACDAKWPIESMLVWDKRWIGPGGSRGLRPAYEQVALWLRERGQVHDRGLADVQPFPWSGVKPTGHPAEKPVPLLQWCIRSVTTDSDRLVIDPFMGSARTGVAALSLGHRFAGCDMDEAWCEKSARWLADAEAGGVQAGLFAVGA